MKRESVEGLGDRGEDYPSLFDGGLIEACTPVAKHWIRPPPYPSLFDGGLIEARCSLLTPLLALLIYPSLFDGGLIEAFGRASAARRRGLLSLVV